MKNLRRITWGLFIATLCMFIIFSLHERLTADTTYPEITLPAEPLEISITASEEVLFRDVTAFDEKDGDLTGKLLIESISPFVADGECIVTYAVADSDSHVAKAARRIHYTDYTSPQFTLTRALVLAVDERADFRSIVGAYDCIDGDISNKITFLATDYIASTIGVFTLSVQVTNSRGDSICLDLPVYVEQNDELALTLPLKEPLIYIQKGETPDFESCVSGVYRQDQPVEEYQMVISTNFDSNTPGTYSVHYYVANEDGYEGHTILIVIVEE